MKKILILSSLILSLTGCSRVNTGEIGIKTTNGTVNKEPLNTGLYFYFPVIQDIYKLNTRVQTTEGDSQAASKDLQNVQTQITLNYHLGTLNPVGYFTRLGSDQEKTEITIVKPAMSESFKAVVAQFNAEELVTKRDLVSQQINSLLNSKLKQYDLYVDSISITGFKFSEGYSQAIEAKQVAEQNANKAKNDLQRITVEAQQKVVEAQADAQAMNLRKQSVTPELIQLKQLEIQQQWVAKWNGQLPTYSFGGNSPNTMINLPTK